MATLTRKQRELFHHLELTVKLVHQAHDELGAAQRCATAQTHGELTTLGAQLRSVCASLVRLEQNVMLEHQTANVRLH